MKEDDNNLVEGIAAKKSHESRVLRFAPVLEAGNKPFEYRTSCLESGLRQQGSKVSPAHCASLADSTHTAGGHPLPQAACDL